MIPKKINSMLLHAILDYMVLDMAVAALSMSLVSPGDDEGRAPKERTRELDEGEVCGEKHMEAHRHLKPMPEDKMSALEVKSIRPLAP